jgi:hypothetical protein
MELSTKFGFAFLCMPKCASTAIEAAIHQHCNISFSGHPSFKHMDARTFCVRVLNYHRTKVPNREIESFCLMRDPFEWVFSWYRYRKREEIRNLKHPSRKNYTGGVTFDEFVEAYTSTQPSYAKVGMQTSFFKMKDGIIGVDYIFSMNRMDLVSKFLSKKIRQKISISVSNASPKQEYSLAPNLAERLRDYLKEDIAVFRLIDELGMFSKKLHADKFYNALQAAGVESPVNLASAI